VNAIQIFKCQKPATRGFSFGVHDNAETGDCRVGRRFGLKSRWQTEFRIRAPADAPAERRALNVAPTTSVHRRCDRLNDVAHCGLTEADPNGEDSAS